jgi:type IV conjugative transfer system protein TraL
MSSSNKHVIIHYLDEPIRILYWTKGQMMFFFGVPMFGMIMEMEMAGLVVTFLGAFVMRQYKKRFPDVNIWILSYWYLPRNNKNKCFPLSCNRNYVG